MHGPVQRREGLRAEERRREELVLRSHLDLLADKPEDDTAVDDEPRHADARYLGRHEDEGSMAH
jgi:hypothetical protein